MIGNLTRDPELKYTTKGNAVVSFSLALNRKYKDVSGELKEETAFIGCVAWDKTADLINTHLQKGSGVLVEGRLTQESYEDKEGKKVSKTKVIVGNVQFLTKVKSNNTENTPEEVAPF